MTATSSAPAIGFFGQNGVGRQNVYTRTYATLSTTIPAYTTSAQTVAYSGGSDATTQTNLNTLRVAYENLRASHDALLGVVNQMLADFQTYGLMG